MRVERDSHQATIKAERGQHALQSVSTRPITPLQDKESFSRSRHAPSRQTIRVILQRPPERRHVLVPCGGEPTDHCPPHLDVSRVGVEAKIMACHDLPGQQAIAERRKLVVRARQPLRWCVHRSLRGSETARLAAHHKQTSASTPSHAISVTMLTHVARVNLQVVSGRARYAPTPII